MALKIIPDSDPILHTACESFNPRNTDFPLKETIQEMFVLMEEKGGIGLAAPQVGINMRFFVMEMNGVTRAVLNPKITWKNNELSNNTEGCLSYPGIIVRVVRPRSIRVQFSTASGFTRKKTLYGTDARCFMHEVDHLNGVVIGDIGELVSVRVQHNRPEKK